MDKKITTAEIIKKSQQKQIMRGAQQQYKKDQEIQHIWSRYQSTGTMNQNRRQPYFADVSNVGDYLDAQLRVQRADEQFRQMPANVRFRFKNNPVELLKFLENTENRLEAIKLGLINPVQGPPQAEKTGPVGDEPDTSSEPDTGPTGAPQSKKTTKKPTKKEETE